MNKENPMCSIRLEKITLNIGAGEAGETARVEKAKKVLEKITNKKVVITKTHKRTTFGTAKGRDIGVKITIRGREAKDLLKRLFQAVNNKLKVSQFDSQGNFSFGVEEYIHIPDVSYDPKIGIFGLDVCVSLERPGYRVKRRKVKKSKIGKKHKLNKVQAIEWVKKEFKVEVK